MKRFMLISVVEREIGYLFFDKLEEAQKQMREEMEDSCSSLEEWLEDDEAEITDMYGWINEGNNHDNYDWLILDLEKEMWRN